jgi:predicted Zn-dependent protease
MAYVFRRQGGGGGGSLKLRFILALIVAGGALFSYYSTREYNPIINEVQHVDLSVDQEIALGLQAAPEMASQYGGEAADPEGQALVDRVGKRILERSSAKDSPYRFEFHLLADTDTINAFALPGGQVFITEALLKRLETEGQLATVLAHEMGHVVARHGAQHLAKAKLTQGLTGAAVLATYDPNNPRSQNTAMVAALVGQLVNLRYGREDELQSDQLGVRFASEAGYDPRAMIRVMEILEKSMEGKGRPPEFFSTHPNPEHRIQRIQNVIAERYPKGVPGDLQA